jgi:hypothetical protein
MVPFILNADDDAVKPVNPVIPEPIPRYTPISQKDQSYPIPPRIITNMNSPIKSKETQQKIIEMMMMMMMMMMMISIIHVHKKS